MEAESFRAIYANMIVRQGREQLKRRVTSGQKIRVQLIGWLDENMPHGFTDSGFTEFGVIVSESKELSED